MLPSAKAGLVLTYRSKVLSLAPPSGSVTIHPQATGSASRHPAEDSLSHLIPGKYSTGSEGAAGRDEARLALYLARAAATPGPAPPAEPALEPCSLLPTPAGTRQLAPPQVRCSPTEVLAPFPISGQTVTWPTGMAPGNASTRSQMPQREPSSPPPSVPCCHGCLGQALWWLLANRDPVNWPDGPQF